MEPLARRPLGLSCVFAGRALAMDANEASAKHQGIQMWLFVEANDEGGEAVSIVEL